VRIDLNMTRIRPWIAQLKRPSTEDFTAVVQLADY